MIQSMKFRKCKNIKVDLNCYKIHKLKDCKSVNMTLLQILNKKACSFINYNFSI